jgi:hypothetical protein
MHVEPNILFTVHEGAPFVGGVACAHNLLQKGRPFIMRLQQPNYKGGSAAFPAIRNAAKNSESSI